MANTLTALTEDQFDCIPNGAYPLQWDDDVTCGSLLEALQGPKQWERLLLAIQYFRMD